MTASFPAGSSAGRAAVHARSTSAMPLPRRRNCGTRRAVIDSMRPIVGATPPNSVMTLSDVSTWEAFENNTITLISMMPMHAPYTKLSR